MSWKKFNLVFSLIIITLTPSAFAKEPANFALLKVEIRNYHDSGAYAKDIREVVNEAETFLTQRVQQKTVNNSSEKLAIVFDIDETVLSNYQKIAKYDFHFSKELFRKEQRQGDDLPILATKHLYNLAEQNHVAVFFITGRPLDMKEITATNLRKAGFTHWDGIYFKPDTYALASVVAYKSSVRKKIADNGYNIVLNIGDQTSDLVGGYCERTYKLPNPYYFIP